MRATGPSARSTAFRRRRSNPYFICRSPFYPIPCTQNPRNASRQLARPIKVAGFSSCSPCGRGAAKHSSGRSAHGTCTERKWTTMKKKLPRFRSDKEAEDFVEKADLTEYDLSAMRPIRFEFQPKSERVNMRLPRQLLDAVRVSAAKAGVPYQRFIRQALENAVRRKRA